MQGHQNQTCRDFAEKCQGETQIWRLRLAISQYFFLLNGREEIKTNGDVKFRRKKLWNGSVEIKINVDFAISQKKCEMEASKSKQML